MELSSGYSLAHILPTSSSKSAPDVAIFDILQCKTNSRYSLVRFLPFPRSRREAAETETLLWRPRKPLYTKKRPESVVTREFTHGRTVALLNYLMMCGWHDDVVDMMVGMLAMTTNHNSEWFWLDFLWSTNHIVNIGELSCLMFSALTRANWGLLRVGHVSAQLQRRWSCSNECLLFHVLFRKQPIQAAVNLSFGCQWFKVTP